MTWAQAGFVLLAFVGLSRPGEALEVGQTVPALSARSLDGVSFSLNQGLPGHRTVAVVFLSTLCPYARLFGAHLGELERQYGDRGLLLVAVNSNSRESAAEVVADARRRGYGFPMVKDADHSIADALGARVTPESFLIDAYGRLRYRGRVKSKQGATDLQDAVEAVLAGREVKTPVAKAFGCAIQRD